MDFLLLAQESTVKTAGETVTVLERVIQGGVPLICLAVAAVFLVLAIWQWRKNNNLVTINSTLQAEHSAALTALQSAHAAAFSALQSEQAIAHLTLEKEFRGKVESLLREMIDRGEDNQQVIANSTQATRDMTTGFQQLAGRIEYIERNSRPSPGG